MTKLPIMPVLYERLLVDTDHMSNEEFGCYMRLLLAAWGRGGMIEAKDMPKLGGHVTPTQWKRLSRAVVGPKLFEEISPGFFAQQRLLDERENALTLKAKKARQTEAAREAAARKRGFAVRRTARQTKPVTEPQRNTVANTVTAPEQQVPNGSVTVSNPYEEELLPINRQSSSSSEKVADIAAVDNPQGQGGKEDAAEHQPVGGGGRGGPEAMPQSGRAADDHARPRSLFARLAEERRRREGEGTPQVPEQGG